MYYGHAAAVAAFWLFSTSAHAETVLPPVAAAPDVPTEAASDSWHARGEILTRHLLLGYEPAMLPSEDGEVRFRSRNVIGQRNEWRGRISFGSRFFELQFEPYTNSSVAGLAVVKAGLEIYGFVPLTSFFRVGLYHHSAHNFARAEYGRGMSLNAVVLDLDLQRTRFVFREKPGYVAMRAVGHWYFQNNGSPYFLTRDADVYPADVGTTLWRAGIEFEARHPWGKAECRNDVRSQRFAPASMRGECAATLAVGRQLFGVWSEHVQIGPFAAYGLNFSRQSEFGKFDYALGLRFDVIMMESSGS